ncbi:DUF5132 domain-containing protein [Streptomyces regalis]|uniref:DUF5132 domain-containing protein n=1 Tax=Streptomyces regalis TaxID=68262 RepID=A0A0X3VDJ3_9ACTN|nr:DUF5132 domain-containing protein [Streptomyces regalis]KUL42758.1 hypothetical protein ADL12_08910 [Streptomyces regalis]
MSPVPVAPFIVGVIAAPLVQRIAKPIARGAVKTSVGLVMDVKHASLRAAEGMRDVVVDAAGKNDAPETASERPTDGVVTPKKRTGAAKAD